MTNHSPLPAHAGAPGRQQHEVHDSGDNLEIGSHEATRKATKLAFNAGNAQAPIGHNIPHHIREGAFEPDASVKSFTGDPRDCGLGHPCPPEVRNNRVPSIAGVRRQGAI